MTAVAAIADKGAELQRAFDLAFASPPSPVSQEIVELLTIRVAGNPYLIRLHDAAALVPKRTVVPVPAATLNLLGLAGIRGAIVPVFALASILGYGDALDSPDWMILCGVEEPIALAFSGFDGYLRVPKSALFVHETLGATGQYLKEAAATDAGVQVVINVPLVVSTLRNRSSHHQRVKG